VGECKCLQCVQQLPLPPAHPAPVHGTVRMVTNTTVQCHQDHAPVLQGERHAPRVRCAAGTFADSVGSDHSPAVFAGLITALCTAVVSAGCSAWPRLHVQPQPVLLQWHPAYCLHLCHPTGLRRYTARNDASPKACPKCSRRRSRPAAAIPASFAAALHWSHSKCWSWRALCNVNT
jgi:hypothetical protein